MLSIQKKYETDEKYKYFFMKMFSVLHYYEGSPFIARKDDASEIASKSFTVLMILTYIKRISEYIEKTEQVSFKQIYAGFREKFITALGVKLNDLFDVENATEFQDPNNVNKFRHILRQFLERIDPIYLDILDLQMPMSPDSDSPQSKFDIDFEQPLMLAMVNYYLDNYEKEKVFEDFETEYSKDAVAPEVVTAKETAMASDVLMKMHHRIVDKDQTRKDILIGQIIHFLSEDFIILPRDPRIITEHFTQIGDIINRHVVPGDIVTMTDVDGLISALIAISEDTSEDLKHISEIARTEIATKLGKFDMEMLRKISDDLSENLESRLQSDAKYEARGGKSKRRRIKINKRTRKQIRKQNKK